MIRSYSQKQFYFLLAVSLAVFISFVFLVAASYAQEGKSGEIYNKDRAVQVVAEKGGPGGCNSEESCRTFCDNPDNFKTCMDWAKDNGVISNENFEKHSKFVEKTGPGGCRTPETCRVFCENPDNHDVCINHAVQEGFMSKEEAQKIKEFEAKAEEFRKKSEEFRKQSREFEKPKTDDIDPGFNKEKARQVLSTQGGPGGCKTFDACEDFCENPDNQKICFDFAEQHDLFEHKDKAVKVKHLIEEGGPGGCRGEKACHEFCENEANFETCISFAEKSGIMPAEEIERAKNGIQALKEGGPVGCKSQDQCEKVCQDPANQHSCFEWAKKHNLISDEEIELMEEVNKIREEFESKRHEFENRPMENSRPPEGFMPPGEFLGPGGCKGANECREYCSKPEHQKECGEGFKTPSGSQPPGFGGTMPSEDDDRDDDKNTLCVQIYEPVCASDGHTYSNECEAHRAGITIKHEGKCESYTSPEPTSTKTICPLMPEVACKEGQYKKMHYNPDGCPISECVSAEPYPTRPPEPYPSYSPEPQPTQSDPAKVCSEKGGSWTGTECKLPSTEPTSLEVQSFLGAVSKFLLKQ